jgi:hypothetical protein
VIVVDEIAGRRKNLHKRCKFFASENFTPEMLRFPNKAPRQ